MSLKYKFDMLTTKEKSNNESLISEETRIERHGSPGHSRKLLLINIDGIKSFFNYSFLTFASFNPSENVIILLFTTHEVSLKGSRLDVLFEEFLSETVKLVTAIDTRYSGVDAGNDAIVNEINIQKINSY